METKQDALRTAEETFDTLKRSITGLDETTMTRTWLGSWGVREILVHTSAWHREMIPALQRLGRGEPAYPSGVSYDDADAWSARFVEAARGMKLADIVAELDASHGAFLGAARTLADEHFAPGAPAREIFDGTAPGHYREHAAQIQDWRRTSGL
jgi:hypothetical protein